MVIASKNGLQMQVTVLQPFYSSMPVAICPTAHALNRGWRGKLRTRASFNKRTRDQGASVRQSPEPRWLKVEEGQTQQTSTGMIIVTCLLERSAQDVRLFRLLPSSSISTRALNTK